MDNTRQQAMEMDDYTFVFEKMNRHGDVLQKVYNTESGNSLEQEQILGIGKYSNKYKPLIDWGMLTMDNNTFKDPSTYSDYHTGTGKTDKGIKYSPTAQKEMYPDPLDYRHKPPMALDDVNDINKSTAKIVKSKTKPTTDVNGLTDKTNKEGVGHAGDWKKLAIYQKKINTYNQEQKDLEQEQKDLEIQKTQHDDFLDYVANSADQQVLQQASDLAFKTIDDLTRQLDATSPNGFKNITESVLSNLDSIFFPYIIDPNIQDTQKVQNAGVHGLTLYKIKDVPNVFTSVLLPNHKRDGTIKITPEQVKTQLMASNNIYTLLPSNGLDTNAIQRFDAIKKVKPVVPQVTFDKLSQQDGVMPYVNGAIKVGVVVNYVGYNNQPLTVNLSEFPKYSNTKKDIRGTQAGDDVDDIFSKPTHDAVYQVSAKTGIPVDKLFQAQDDWYHDTYHCMSWAREYGTYGTPEFNEGAKQVYNNLKAVMDETILPKHTSWRAIRSLSQETMNFLQNLKKNEVLRLPGFTATSLNKPFCDSWRMRGFDSNNWLFTIINGGGKGVGTYVHFSENDTTGEFEVLLNNNSQFIVIDTDPKKGESTLLYIGHE